MFKILSIIALALMAQLPAAPSNPRIIDTPPSDPSACLHCVFKLDFSQWTTDVRQFGSPCNGAGYNGVVPGISNYGGWTPAGGSCPGIFLVANAPGSAGRGYRFFVANGTNSAGGSFRVSFGSIPGMAARVPEYWVKYRVRFQPGLRPGSDSSCHKALYMVGDMAGSGVSGSYLCLGPNVTRLTVQGTNFTNNNNPGGFINAGLGGGGWHTAQYHFKTGLGNGVVEAWFDGVRFLHRTDVNTASTSGYSGFVIPENGNWVASGDMWYDLDDLQISTVGQIP